MSRVKFLTPVTIESAQSSLPAPSVSTDGEAIPGSQNKYRISLSSDGDSTLTEGAIYGYDGSSWSYLEKLNNGDDIVLSAAVGRDFIVESLGGYERAAVGAATVSAGDITVLANPIEEREE